MRVLTAILIAAVVVSSLLALPARPANAQQFPISGTLDEMERQASQLAAEADAAARAAADAKQRADIDRASSSTEHRDLVKDLTTKKAYYIIGLLYHHLGSWRDAEKYFKTSLRTEAPAWQASSYVMLARLEMIDVFDGKEPSRWERSIDRDLEKTQGRLNEALDKLQIKLQDAQSRTGLGDMSEYFGNLKDWLRREFELKQAIQQNTWDTEAIWSLIRLYRDNLDMLHLARAWAELYREYFLLNQRTLSGEIDSEIAKILVAEGLQSEAMQRLEPGKDMEDAMGSLEDKIKAIEKKIADANARGERAQLTDEEKEISKLDPNRFKNDQKKNYDEAQKAVKRTQDFIDNAAGRKHEGGDDRDRPRRDGKGGGR